MKDNSTHLGEAHRKTPDHDYVVMLSLFLHLEAGVELPSEMGRQLKKLEI